MADGSKVGALSIGSGTTVRTRTDVATQPVLYRVASSRADLESAYRLVYQQYLQKGYIEDQPSGLWFSIHNALPEATTFLTLACGSQSGSSLIGTVTLVPDSPLGLPMDSIYHVELDRLRRAGRRIGEVTMLAFGEDGTNVSDGAFSMDRCRVFFALFKLVWNEARCRFGLDDLCIAIHPTHSLIYDQIGFQDFAPIVTYDRVNGNPALGKRIDLRTVRVRLAAGRRSSIYHFFFDQAPACVLDRPKFVMTPEDLAYFFLERSETLHRASRSAIDYLLGRYRFYLALQR